MGVEVAALEACGTWQLVPHSANANIVTCKWVFTLKYHPNDTISRHKAHLVARGFTQAYGINYPETFSPVVRLNSVLILRSRSSWSNLLGMLIKGCHPSFTSCTTDPFVLTKKIEGGLVILAVYVDDILVTGSDEASISAIKAYLQEHLNIRDLGTPRYFLGIEFVYQDGKLALTQRKYALDML